MSTFRGWALLTVIAVTGCGAAQHDEEHADPELVFLSGALANDFVDASHPSMVFSRLRVDTSQVPNAQRPPINLALVIDTSGSMDGAPIRHARAASLAMLDALRPQDRLAVIAFHSEPEVLLDSTRLEGADLDGLRARIGRMESRGTTDLAGGLQAGLEELVRNFESEGINRLVLLSDGVPNDSTSIVPLATAAGERGVNITAVGLGDDYDETLMGHVAQQSGGRFHYVADAAEIERVFRDEVLRFERLLARDLVLELRPGPGVRIDAVVGQVTTGGSAGTVTLALGDVSEGEQRDVLVRLQTSPRRPGASVELLDAVLRFEDAVDGAGQLERRLFLGARASNDQAEFTEGRNEEVERAVARTQAAAVTIQAIETARSGALAEARAVLSRAAREMEIAARRDAALESDVARMRALSEALPAALPAGAPAPSAARDAARGVRPEGLAEEEARSAAVIRTAHDSAMRTIQVSAN